MVEISFVIFLLVVIVFSFAIFYNCFGSHKTKKNTEVQKLSTKLKKKFIFAQKNVEYNKSSHQLSHTHSNDETTCTCME